MKARRGTEVKIKKEENKNQKKKKKKEEKKDIYQLNYEKTDFGKI